LSEAPKRSEAPVGAERLLRRSERLLPFACVSGAFLLAASELMTTFEFTPAGGDPLAIQHAYDRHHYAILIVAAFAFIATVVAVLTGSKPAALAVAFAGAIGLLVFLIVDLPDANQVGALNEPTQGLFNTKAVPQPGFWLELVGSLGLALSGAALATLTPGQLYSIRPRWLLGSGTPPDDGEPFDQAAADAEADELARARAERSARRRG
jgi:hypothetical protein